MDESPSPWAATIPSRAGAPGDPVLWLVHALGDSSLAFAALTRHLRSRFEVFAADWPGAGAASGEPDVTDLEGLGIWLAQAIERYTPAVPVGLVGHSLGAAVTVKAARRLRRTVGLFSIEGNLTAADAYLSGRAAAFEAPQDYRNDLLHRVHTMAEGAVSTRSEALWRYHESLGAAEPEALWRIGRSAVAESRLDALGEEYRALTLPTLYYWSRGSTPPETQAYVQRHMLNNVEFAGGHWPMIEQPLQTANQVAAFFQPLFRGLGSPKG